MNTLKTHMHSLVAALLLSFVFGSACVTFENEPTVEELGSHSVRIRPSCNGSSLHSTSHQDEDGSRNVLYYEFTCGDTKVLISGNLLSVNGKSYGTLNEGDMVTVDYGKVRVNSEVRAEVPGGPTR